MQIWGSSMRLQIDATYIQAKADATRLKNANVNDTKATFGDSELANELTAEPYVESTGGGSKLIFVFVNNTTKRYFKREMN